MGERRWDAGKAHRSRGGGHAHLYSLARVGELTRRGFDVTLVDRSPYLYYSGMATGVISGAYAPDEHRIDIRRLVEEGGGRFVQGRIAEIRTENRELVLENGQTVPYDAASVCLGSEIQRSGVVENVAGVVAVKPVVNTLEIRRRLLTLGKDRAPRILVVGRGRRGLRGGGQHAGAARPARSRRRVHDSPEERVSPTGRPEKGAERDPGSYAR